MQKPQNKTKKAKAAFYARTSTKTNLLGDSQGRQLRASLAHAQADGGKGSQKKSIDKVTECISGMLPLAERRKLLSLLDGSYKTIYVESLRALGRKASVIDDIYERAKETRTEIAIADMPGLMKLDASPTERFQLRVVAAVQELERDTIVHRLQQGLQAAKKNKERQGLPTKVQGRKSYLEKKEEGGLSRVQRCKLVALCKQREQGAFGWRPLASKMSKLLRLERPMKHEAARTMSKALLKKVKK